MNDKQVARSGGIGFLGALFLVLLTLKLTGHISTSWLWVSAPLWGPLALALLPALVLCIVGVVALIVDKVGSYRRRR